MGDQVLLLLVGFALTSVFGGGLGMFFQTRGWSHQHRVQQRDEERAQAIKVFEEVSSLLDKRLYRMRLVFWAAERRAGGADAERLDQALDDYREVLTIWNDNLNRSAALVHAYFGGDARLQLESELYEEYSAIGRVLDLFVRDVQAPHDVDVGVPPIGERLARLGHRICNFNALLLRLLQDDQLGRAAPDTEGSAAGAARPVLQLGDRGSAVARLQRALRRAGTFDGPEDGIFGTLTETGVRAAQQSAGLEVDGIVGLQTWAAVPQENADSREQARA